MRPVRYGTVIWGVLLLVGAALVLASAVLGASSYEGLGVVWLVVGVGALLVLAATIGAVARALAGRAASRARAAKAAETAAAAAAAAAETAAPAAPPARKSRAKNQPVD